MYLLERSRPVSTFSLFRLLKKIILIGVCFCIHIAHAQQGRVLGRLLTAEGEIGIEFASVALLTVTERNTVKGTFTDVTGDFSFEQIKPGEYILRASMVGFKSYESDVLKLNLNGSPINLGNILLIADAQQLQEVTITSQKPLIEQKLDRTIMNVENSVLSEGSTALELLEKAPGVAVDDEGNVSLKGRSGATVMLNGKLTYLSGAELTNLLKGTNSNAVFSIEIMSNPSAKYDAAGNAGIVNIVLKKNVKTGLNGSFTVNGGSSRNERYGSGGSLNYRGEKVNIYGNYNYGFRGETEYLDFTRRFYDGNFMPDQPPKRTSYQHTNTNEPLHTHNFRTGVDFFLNERNTLGMLINGNLGKYTHDSKTSNSMIDQETGIPLWSAISSNYDKQKWKSITYNLNYVHRFKREGQHLSADIDYSSNSFTSNLNLDTRYLNDVGEPLRDFSSRRGYVPSVTDVYVAKLDYVQPLAREAKIELGGKSSYVKADNNLRYDTLYNNTWVPDNLSSNHFNYTEYIHAAYVNLHAEWGKFSLQVGLRGEYTTTRGHQITTDSLVNRNYFQLFPSFFLTRKLDEEQQLQLAYSRRIERPDYGDLNPFRTFRDPFLYYEGNPFLRPELTHTLQLSHTFKSNYITAISYNRTTDVMNWLMRQNDATNTTYQSPQNLSRFINYGISFTAMTELAPWWTGSHFGNVFRNIYEGHPDGGDFTNSITSFSLNSQNTFKIAKTISAELSGFYESKTVYGISRGRPYYAINTGIQKQVLDNKATLKLMVNDIFQTRQFRRTAQYENIDMYTHIRLDSRMAMLSFTYRFGKQGLKSRERKTGSEDIQNRVGG